MLFLILIPLIAMATAQKCQQITIPMCKGIGYNFTQLPNQFNHDNQEEAGLEVHQYWPLVEIKCSLDLRFFICSLYVPICMEDYKGSVPVCRELCLRAREGCEPVMTHYGFTWPDRFICSHFPPFGPNSICMLYRCERALSCSAHALRTCRGERPVVGWCSARDSF